MEKNDKVHPMEEKAYRFGKTLKKLPSWGWYIISLATIIIVFNVHYSHILLIFSSLLVLLLCGMLYKLMTENGLKIILHWRNTGAFTQIRKQKME